MNSIPAHSAGAFIRRLPVDAAHAEVFDFEEFLDAVFRAFAAMPLSFMPPKGAISVG
jgi:hypothetical protein